MKQLFFIITALLGFYACSESSTKEKPEPSPIEQLLELNGIDKNRLSNLNWYGIKDGIASYPELPQWPNTIILTGYKDRSDFWIAVFDKSSNKLLYEFTDDDKPITTAYGQTIQWEYPSYDAPNSHFINNLCVFPDCFSFIMAYDSNDKSLSYWDLITCYKDNKHTRYNIGEYPINNGYLITLKPWDDEHVLVYKDGNNKCGYIIYNIDKQEVFFQIGALYEENRILYNLLSATMQDDTFLVSKDNSGQWLSYYNSTWNELEYANCHLDNIEEPQTIVLFEESTDDFTHEPKYTTEYLQKEINDHRFKVIRTDYDGTREVKFVHIYIDETGGHVEIE